jgi:hypothetical protein
MWVICREERRVKETEGWGVREDKPTGKEINK